MILTINNAKYKVIKLLGRGKGGYSYLVKRNDKTFVAKQIHHEPCSYYTFSNKLESEISAYNKLVEMKIKVPRLLEVDKENEIILKEYIDGNTIDYYVLNDKMLNLYYIQVKKYQNITRKNNINLDWFPTNFVVKKGKLYYIDYECNEYSDIWNYENWGSLYWNKNPIFFDYFSKTSKMIFTERLILRKLRKDDAEPIFMNWASDDEVTKFLYWRTHKDISMTNIVLNDWLIKYYNEDRVYRWGIVETISHELIGMIDVVRYIDDKYPEIGYVLSRNHWNKGYMCEACKAVIKYLFKEGFDKIYIRAVVENIASNKVAIKCGGKLIYQNQEESPKDGKTVTVNNYLIEK